MSVSDLNKSKGNDNLNYNLRILDPPGELQLQDNEVDLSLKASTLNDSPDAAVGSDSYSENSYSNLRDSNVASYNTQSLDKQPHQIQMILACYQGKKKQLLVWAAIFLNFLYKEMEGTPVVKSGRTCKSDILSNTQYEIG